MSLVILKNAFESSFRLKNDQNVVFFCKFYTFYVTIILVILFSVVDSMRQQRIGMVRTKEQYENIYDILRLAIESRQVAKSSRI